MSNEVVIELTDQKQSAAFVYISSLNSAFSRRSMDSALGIIARKLGAANAYEFHWEELRYPELAAIQTWLAGTRSPATTRRMVSAVRGTIKAAWRLGYIDTNEYLRTVDLPPVHGNSRMGRRATEEELAALFATCRTGPPNRGARDLAILTIQFRLGLRVGEILAAVRSDYQEGTLLVHGKGKKLREVYLYGGIRSALEEWLGRRGDHAGALRQAVVLATQKNMFGALKSWIKDFGAAWKYLSLMVIVQYLVIFPALFLFPGRVYWIVRILAARLYGLYGYLKFNLLRISDPKLYRLIQRSLALK